MDKIKELLKQMGGSDELIEEVTKSLDEWEQTTRTQLDEEFGKRLQKAKEVCMEEVSGYKKDLARRIEIFLESQRNAIERDVRGRGAIEESKAVNLLTQAKAVLEGVQIDGQNGDLQALSDENAKLRRHVVAVTEERDGLKKRATHAQKIAGSALERNKLLEAKAAGSAAKTITENKGGTKLEASRSKGGKTQSTRPTRASSQRPGKKQAISESSGDPSVLSIASQVDEIA